MKLKINIEDEILKKINVTTESIKSSKRKIWKHCGVIIFSLITDVSISISTKCAFCIMSYFANLKPFRNVW